ncbi:hypothetical protein G6F56_013505 [Rhizopus delemar]|nr:hypothetical protein G6F56_013505 [Rhizopus delemar]
MADADQHVGAADPVQAAAAHHLAVLQVALAPAAVTHQQVGQRRRAFLVAAAQVRHHVRGPAATAHQRGFHEIVAEHVAAERLAPRQRRQAG